MQDVVLKDKLDPLALGELKRAIPVTYKTSALRVGVNSYSLITSREILRDADCLVRRRIVYDQDLEPVLCLLQDRRQAVIEKRRAVE
jgi:hypothetical protein